MDCGDMPLHAPPVSGASALRSRLAPHRLLCVIAASLACIPMALAQQPLASRAGTWPSAQLAAAEPASSDLPRQRPAHPAKASANQSAAHKAAPKKAASKKAATSKKITTRKTVPHKVAAGKAAAGKTASRSAGRSHHKVAQHRRGTAGKPPRPVATAMTDARMPHTTPAVTEVAALVRPASSVALRDMPLPVATSLPQAAVPPVLAAIAPAPAVAAAPAMPPTETGIASHVPAPPVSATPVAASAAPVAASAAVGGRGTVLFAPGASVLSDEARRGLAALATRIGTAESRVQLVAYASAQNEDANTARRVSLARAVTVRSYLIDRGVRSARMEVRALGSRSDGGGPADRVDIVVLDR
jgi:outer membrane protein OmpA-like peptidoglycan-associated protein